MRLSKKFAAIAITAGVALTATAAFAYWTTSGSGTGSAAAADGQIDNLSFVTDAITDMFPGDSEQTLRVAVTNDSTQSAYVASVKAYLTVVPALSTDVCGAGDFLLNGDAAPGAEADAVSLTWTAQDLAPTTGTDDATGTIQFNNLGTNQDGCKGAAVTLNYLAS
ncbi:MAG TPA: hypothetical protein VGL92_12730 [Acidimicrobiia bacterium]